MSLQPIEHRRFGGRIFWPFKDRHGAVVWSDGIRLAHLRVGTIHGTVYALCCLTNRAIPYIKFDRISIRVGLMVCTWRKHDMGSRIKIDKLDAFAWFAWIARKNSPQAHRFR